MTRYHPQRGDTYVHDHFLDTDWVPGPGQKYADAPKARMKVIHVTSTRVTSTYEASGMGRFTIERDTFCRTYGEQALASRAQTPTGPKHPDIRVRLTGEDGNAFVIIGAVARELRREGVPTDEIEQFRAEALSGDYDNVLRTAMRWVAVA